MKKTLIIAAVAASFTSAAYAQSSVTLYGLIDAGLTYTNNQAGSRNLQATSGSVDASRWGLRGSEDLGGGLKAIFTLENGFNIENGQLGQKGSMFSRQAFVGLAGDQFGAVTLGRQYDSVVDYLSPLALTGTNYGGTQFAHPFDNDGLNNSFSVNNSIKFQSANYGGFKFGAQYGFSNQAAGFTNNREFSGGASYTYGGLNVAAAYMQVDNNIGGLVPGATTVGNLGGAVASDSTFVAKRQRTWGAGVNYNFGPATAGFVFTQTRLNRALGISSSASGVANGGIGLNGTFARFNNFEVNGRYNFTPAWSVAGAYTYTSGYLDGAHPKWNQFSLQTDYALSKRTNVYLQGEYQRVSQSGLNLGADINGLAASGNNKQVAVTAGVRHSF